MEIELLTVFTLSLDGTSYSPMLVDGEPVELIEYTYVSARMGVSSVSGEVRTRRCLDELWTGREFVELRGERFFLDHVPSSSKSNEDERYVHSLEFRAGRDILLSGVYFCDAVAAGSASADRPQSNSYDVKFVGTLDDFVQRFNDVLAYRGLDERFSVSVESGIVGTTESKEIAFSDVTLFEALGKAVEVWEVPFYFEGDSAVFGSADGESLVPVEYGADKELLSVSMNNRGEKTVTRISGHGGTDNVPYYYPNPSPKGTLGVGGTASGVTIRDMVLFSQKVGSGDVLTYLGKEADFGGIQLDFGGKTGRNATGGVTAVVEDVNVASGTLYPFRVSLGADLSQGFADVLRVPLYANVGNTEQIPGTTDLYYLKTVDPSSYYYGDIDSRPGADVAQKGWELVVDRVEVVFGDGNNSVTRQVEFECDYSQPEIAPEDRGLYPERVLSGIILDFGEIIASLPSGADLSACTVYIVGHLSSYVLWQVNTGSGFEPAGFFCESMSAVGAFAPQGWFLGEAGLGQDLSVVGLRQSGEPVVGSTITQTVLSYITPTGVLMPSIYRQSGGASRFYDALNDTYTDPETGGYYTFEHEYDPLNPHEHVESFEDVYPTIRNLKDGSGNPLNVLSDVWFDPGFNVRDLLPDGQTLKYQYFFVKLKALGFNLFDCAIEDGDMALVMSDGPCAGCHFKILVNSAGKNPVQRNSNGTLKKDASGYGVIDNGSLQEAQQDTTSNNVWVALYLDDSTFGGGEYGTMPAYDKATGVGPKPSAGDSFTVENILLPQAFFTAAEQELDRQLIKFMAEHNADKFDPSVAFSRVYLAQNPSVRAALSEKSRLSLTYDGRTFSPLYVSQFTLNVKEGEALPEIIVETSDIVEQRSSGLDDRISAITMQTVRAVVPSPGSDIRETDSRYLRKDVEDTAKEKIIFENGLEVGDYRPGRSGLGGTIYTNSAGEAIAEVDFLTVRRKATFSSVEVDALRKVSGTILLSLAEMQCNAVEKVSGGWKCYFKTDTGDGSALENGFAAGDQAICQTFLNNNTHYYWRLVTEVGPDYIVLSESDCDAGSDAPEVGDTIVQLGNRSDASRQAAQVLSCYGSDSPSHVMYAGINSYDLTGRDIWGVVYTQNGGVWEPRFYNYGSMLLGSRDKSGDYVEFDTQGGMTIKADVLIKAGSALANAIAAAGAMSEVEKAFNNDTKISGGLVLTSLIQLGQQSGSDYTVWSGINGLANADRYGKGIAAWYGGPMADLEHPLAGESVFAQSLFRFDGTGYLAGGNITWNADGSGSVAGGNLSWDSNGVPTIAGGIEIGNSGSTIADLLAAMYFQQNSTISTLVELKSAYSYLGVKDGIFFSGATEADFEVQTINGQRVIHSRLPFYSDSFISAGGISDGGGSAGGNATLVAQTYGGTLSATGINPINFYSKERVDQLIATAGTVQTVAGVSPVSGDIPVASLKSALGLGAAAAYGVGSVASGNTGLVTGGDVWTAIDELPEPMVFKGSLGTGGTITSLPAASSANEGFTYKVITAGTYRGTAAKVGDTFISNGSSWVLIPSGDEPEGTVTSVGLSMPTGFLVSSSPITSSGTLTVAFASGYSLPTTAKQSNWDTAYGWGNHANAGYLPAATAASTYATITALNGVSGRVTTLEGRTNWDTYFGVDENGDIYVKKNGNTARNFYSWGAVSAGGLSPGGGSEGASLAAVWASLKTNSDDYANEKINAYHIPIGSGLSVVNGLIVANNTGTVTSVKVGTTTYNPTDGVVSLPAYPTSLPASDVYSWAKAETKPSYAFSEITGTATASQIPTLAISKISGLQDALDGKQASDADLTAIAGLTGTSGFLKKTAANTWTLDTNTYLTTSSAASTYVSGVALNGNYLRVTKNGADTDLTIPYATQAQIPNWAIRTAFNPDAVEHAIESNYGESGSTKTNVPSEFLYGSVLTLSARGFNSNLSAQFLWDVRHGTDYSGWLWFRTKDSSSGWRDWTKVYTELSLTKSVLTDLLESSDGYYVKKSGDTMTGALTVSAQVIPVSMEFRNMSSSAGNGGYIDFHFNNSTADYTSRIIESASGILSISGGLSLGTTLQLGDGVLSWDGSANAWKLTGNFYATGFISAGGVSSGGGTAGVDLTAVWNNLIANTGEGLNKKIHTAHLPTVTVTGTNISGTATYSGTGGSASTLTLNLTAVDTKYSAGTGISISSSNVISLSASEYYSATTSRTANTVLAAPNGSNGVASFRALVAADIPTLTKSKISDFPTNVSAFTNDAGYAKTAQANDFVFASNEWTVIPSGYSGSLWLNYRTVAGADGNLTNYSMGNGKGGYASVTAASFVKSGGTSSQFLKADGSVDTNTYLTGNQTITLSGDVSGSGATAISVTIGQGKVTNAMLAGSIANGKLANSAITINGSSTSLGGSFSTASITAGTAGQSTASSGVSFSVPYVTMNAYGIVTGYGTHTHTISAQNLYDTIGSTKYAPYNANGYLPLSGGASYPMIGQLYVQTGTGISDATGNGLLVYHPTGWNWVTSSQWGVGATDCQGVIRSDNTDLIHAKNGALHSILDASNWTSHVGLQTAPVVRSNYSDVLRDPDYHEYTSRRTAGNITFADGGLHYFLATASMTDAGRPGGDGFILDGAWDNGYWDKQLFVGSTGLMWRKQTGTNTWSSWATVWDSLNSNLSTVAWNASVFQAGGLSTYGASSIEFKTASGATNGGFIDFHYGGSTADFTSRFIEDASGRLSINNAIWVNWSGNVGVGTYLPTSKLQVSGQVLADAFATTNSYQASLNSTGWFKVFTAYNTNATSQTVILQIRRNYHYSNNETYTVAVNVAYNGKISFTQISGCSNTQLIDKIRVEYVNSGSTIIALHYTGSGANTIFVSGIGDGVFCAPTAVSSVNGTAVEFTLQPNGVASNSNIVATGAITAGSASDARLKTNIQSLSAEAAKRIVMALNPVTFTWNEKATELYNQYKGDDLGMIAQEVEPYLPQAVGTIFENYKRLDYTKVISPLVKVAQDHESRIRQLEAENRELRKRLNMN